MDQVDFIVADLDRYTRGEVIALALNVNANLRDSPPRGTPIHTGWASANWVPSVGVPYEDSAARQVKDPSPAQVMARAQVAEQGVNETLSWRNVDGPLFSTNNVPYINRLNEGWSGQSPAGFVQAALERAIRQTSSRVASQTSRNARAGSFRANRRKPR